MAEFISSFITGFQNVVESDLSKRFPKIKILNLMDGLIHYRFDGDSRELEKIIYFNNTFFVLKTMKGKGLNFPSLVGSVCSGKNYLLVNIMFKYNLAIEDYNEYVNMLKEKYDVGLKADWERILSKKDLDLLESLSLLTFIQRSDYWDYEHMPLSYAIFDGTVDNILESVENHIDEENIEFLEIFLKK